MASRVCGRASFVLFMLRYFGLRGIAYHIELIIKKDARGVHPASREGHGIERTGQSDHECKLSLQ